MFGKATVAVKPAYTSQNCNNCGIVVKKSLSTRTQVCQCGCRLGRDGVRNAHLAKVGFTPHENAAINILHKGIATVGHSGSFGLDPINAWEDSTATVAGAILL